MLFTVVRYILGILLAVAAVLKLQMLLTDPFADLKLGINPSFIIFASTWELSIAILVFKRTRNDFVWTLLVFTFCIFFFISTSRWWQGTTTCGCLGYVSLPIGVSVIGNFLVLLLLAFCRPRGFGNYAKWLPSLSNATRGHVLGLVLFGCCLWVFQSLMFSPSEKWLGSRVTDDRRKFVVGEPNDVHVEIVNRSSTNARVVGVGTSCTCIMAKDSIKEFQPNQSSIAWFRIVPKTEGVFRQRVILYLDHPQQTRVFLNVTGFVVAQQKENKDDKL